MWDLLREGIKLMLFIAKYILDIGSRTEYIQSSPPKALNF